jgi:hypothetical protein
MSPSPAFIEYDRFAALADRASRNSITDIVDTSSFNSSDCGTSRTASGAMPPAAPEETSTRRGSRAKQHHGEEGEKEKPKSKLKDSWLQRAGGEQSDKGRFKRQSTMDRLRKDKGHLEKRIKRTDDDGVVVVAVPPIKPIASAGKRQTERMVGSIMTRQGRDSKERSAGWKN